jgi:hypothetical protein
MQAWIEETRQTVGARRTDGTTTRAMHPTFAGFSGILQGFT